MLEILSIHTKMICKAVKIQDTNIVMSAPCEKIFKKLKIPTVKCCQCLPIDLLIHKSMKQYVQEVKKGLPLWFGSLN